MPIILPTHSKVLTNMRAHTYTRWQHGTDLLSCLCVQRCQLFCSGFQLMLHSCVNTRSGSHIDTHQHAKAKNKNRTKKWHASAFKLTQEQRVKVAAPSPHNVQQFDLCWRTKHLHEVSGRVDLLRSENIHVLSIGQILFLFFWVIDWLSFCSCKSTLVVFSWLCLCPLGGSKALCCDSIALRIATPPVNQTG